VAVTAYLGLGANLGDRLGNLQRAADLLGEQPGVTVVRSSRVYETEPVGGPPQPPFLNAVLEISTGLSPHELLSACGAIEDEMGRVRVVHWGPRPIDIDILTYGERTIDEADLQVPHPRMHERGFVLAPLAELIEDPPLPGGRHLADVRLEPGVVEGVRPFAPPLAVPS
jgi:2-amino-4-hydroxy-6-hydroxymethyldihydropteridine diphosphokinase